MPKSQKYKSKPIKINKKSKKSKKTRKSKRKLNPFMKELQKARKNDWCPVRTIPCPGEFKRPDIMPDINTIDEYDYISSLYQAVYPLNKNFSILDVIDWHDNLYANKKTEAE